MNRGGWVGLGLLVACSSEPLPAPSPLASSPQASSLLTSLRTRFVLPATAPSHRPEELPPDSLGPAFQPTHLFPHGSAEGFYRSGDRLTPRLRIASSVRRPAAVTLPVRADGGFEVKDATSGMHITVKLRGASAAEAEEADGHVVYRGGYRGQGAVVHRPHAEGTEDFVLLEREPEEHALVYEVDVRGVAGLRLASNVLEFLNEGGDPRLRMTAPLAVDAAGKALGLRLLVSGCVVDEKEALPWGRAVVSPRAEWCEVRVMWGAGAAYPMVVDPAFTTTGSLSVGRAAHTAHVLSGDRVLVVGGTNKDDATNCPNVLCNLAEVWQDGSFASAGSLVVGRTEPTISELSGDRLIVIGGVNYQDKIHCPNNFCKLAEVWENGSFIDAGSLKVGRQNHTASVLSDDRVLVIGGVGLGGGVNCPSQSCRLAEIWQDGSFTDAGSLTAGRYEHTASVLSGDRVLVVGGINSDLTCSGAYCALAELWEGGSFSLTGSLSAGRSKHKAITLSGDRILVVGGNAEDKTLCPGGYCKQAELWKDGSFSAAGSLTIGRTTFSTSVLSDERVLVVGGDNENDVLAEVWKDGSFSIAGSLTVARTDGKVGILSGDRVLVAGGRNKNDEVNCPNGFCKPAEVWKNGSFNNAGSLAIGRAFHTVSVLSGDRVLVIGGWGDDAASCPEAGCKQCEIWEEAVSDVGNNCSSDAQCSSGFCVGGVCKGAGAGGTSGAAGAAGDSGAGQGGLGGNSGQGGSSTGQGGAGGLSGAAGQGTGSGGAGQGGSASGSGGSLSAGSSCADEGTVKKPSGQLISCKGFVCSAGACETTCSKASECVPGYVCQGTVCVEASGQGGAGAAGKGAAGSATAGGGGVLAGGASAAAGGANEEGGCGCAMPGARSRAGGAALLVGLLGARRRRSRATLSLQ